MNKINLCTQHRNLFKLKKYISNVWTLIFWKSEIFLTLLCLCIIQAQNFFQENAMGNWVLKYRILHFFLQIYYLFRLSIKKCSLSSPSLSLLFSSWSSFFAWTRFWNEVERSSYTLCIVNSHVILVKKIVNLWLSRNYLESKSNWPTCILNH